LAGESGSALQQAAVEIEDVAGIGLAPRRLTSEQGDLAVRGRMLGEIIDNDQHMTAAIAEIFAHGEGGERSDPLQPGACAGLATTKMHRSGAP
jgi:hypothetical protein